MDPIAIIYGKMYFICRSCHSQANQICKYHMLIPAIFLEKGPISYTNKGEEVNFNLRVIAMDVSYFSSQ